jgi:hypothetical protein
MEIKKDNPCFEGDKKLCLDYYSKNYQEDMKDPQKK